MADKLIRIKIAGSGTVTEVIESLHELAEYLKQTPIEKVGTILMEYEDNTFVAEFIDLTS